jgi:hypothetical protein
MARKTNPTSTKANARKAASEGTAVRDRVRELSVRALRDRSFSLDEVPRVVNEVLDGAVDGIDRSVPGDQRNVLRQVFDGLSDAMGSVASAGSETVKSLRGRVRTVTDKTGPQATRRARAANEDFLSAVSDFARSTSKQVREELDDMVERARKTGSSVSRSVRGAAEAADGRVTELAGETARAGVRAVRRTVGALAMGAGGLLEGIAEAVMPKSTPERRTTTTGRATSPARKKAKKKTAKKTRRKKV